MHSAELSLVIFTLLSQFSAGMLMSVFIFRVFLSVDSPVNQEKLTFWCTSTAFITMLVALVISFLHLNAPLSSIYAMSNLRESWLSREILMASVFAFLLFLQVAASGFKLVSARNQNILMTLGLIAGLYLVYSMGRLYMIPTVPAWNNPGTMLAFYATAFLTGPAVFLAVHAKLNSKNDIQKNPPAIMLVYGGMIFAGMLMVAAAALFSTPEPTALENIGFEAQTSSRYLMVIRWLLLLFGVAVIIGPFGSLKKPQASFFTYKYVWGFILLVVSEILARFDFYSSYFRIGL
jgi:anaerobic dimethyl sulfoxide reductase subunit C